MKTSENNGLGYLFAGLYSLSPRCHSLSSIENAVADPAQPPPLEAAETSSSPLPLFFSSPIPINVSNSLPSPFWNSFIYENKTCQGSPCFLVIQGMLKRLFRGIPSSVSLIFPEAESSSLGSLQTIWYREIRQGRGCWACFVRSWSTLKNLPLLSKSRIFNIPSYS